MLINNDDGMIAKFGKIMLLMEEEAQEHEVTRALIICRRS